MKRQKIDTAPSVDDGWITIPALALMFCNGNLQVFRNNYRPLVSDADTKKIGRVVWIYGPAFVAAWRKKEDAKKGLQNDVNASADSPWLEEGRKQAALLKKLELEKRRGELVESAKVRTVFMELARLLREMGSDAQKQFGQDAHTFMSRRITKMEKTLLSAVANATEGGEVSDAE